MALAGVTGGELRIKDTIPHDLRMICMRLRPARPAQRVRRQRRDRPRRPAARRQVRLRRLQAQGHGRPLAGLPRRPDERRRRARDAVRGLRADPRVDVREPPRLHRQARRRWAPTSSSATPTARSSPARGGCAARALVSPDIRAGMAMLIAALCAEGRQRDRQRLADRPRLRADRRAPARARRADRARHEPPRPRRGAPRAARRDRLTRAGSGRARRVHPDAS